MAKINLLNPRKVATLPDGFHSDGSNLYLRVTRRTSRQWVFRYMHNGKVRQLGLGGSTERSLAEVRALATEMRNSIKNGRDPAALLKQTRGASVMTFRAYAEELIAIKSPHFRSDKHAKQWAATLHAYAYDAIGSKCPDAITLADVEAILRPLWVGKTETATRLRARIEAVLDFAYVAEGLDRRNPASYRGNLEHRGFANPRKIAPVIHHASAPYSRVPEIMDELRPMTGTPAMCLRFMILTWARSTEGRGASWPEINGSGDTWAVPPHRMKANRLHRVPLCDEAIEILKEMAWRRHPESEAIFPGQNGGLLSDTGINKVLHGLPTVAELDAEACAKHLASARTEIEREAKVFGATVHGFRSSARSWAAAKMEFKPFVLELALAHTNKDKVEAAYQRDDVLEVRRELMKEWGAHCRGGTVIPFPRHAAGEL